MPLFEAEMTFARPLAEVFDFFRRPAHLLQVTPPELHMRLVEGPEVLELGSRITVQGRRWGVPQKIISEVTAFELNVMFTDEQRHGPFRKWVHTHRFAEAADGTRVTDRIDFEPPGGALGLLVKASLIERDLQWVFTFRREKLVQLLGGSQAV